ncbi:MAG: hypothetical protein AAFW89_11015 [Bacteroidota bacterium]
MIRMFVLLTVTVLGTVLTVDTAMARQRPTPTRDRSVQISSKEYAHIKAMSFKVEQYSYAMVEQNRSRANRLRGEIVRDFRREMRDTERRLIQLNRQLATMSRNDWRSFGLDRNRFSKRDDRAFSVRTLRNRYRGILDDQRIILFNIQSGQTGRHRDRRFRSLTTVELMDEFLFTLEDKFALENPSSRRR